MKTSDKPLADTAAAEPLDVAAIMNEIRQRVAEKRRAGVYQDERLPAAMPPAAPDGRTATALPPERHISAMRGAAQADLEGEPIRSHRPVTGPIIMAWKRFTRFWIRRYTDALFLRQSYFNSESTAAAEALLREIRELRREVEALREESGRKNR